MTEEFVVLVWGIWLDDWIKSGGQIRRNELLDAKARIEAVTGWAWSPPFTWDNPPRLALPPGA